jgi:DNA polymerase III subunit epsilon
MPCVTATRSTIRTDEDGVQFTAEGEAIRLSVRVLPASEEELALHVAQLADIEKASKGACVWKKLEGQA